MLSTTNKIPDGTSNCRPSLREELPIGDSANHESVRIHLQATAERIEQELGRERQLNEYEGSEDDWEQQPLPDGPITVGIDGRCCMDRVKIGYSGTDY
jgi:hypothetical protein